MNISKWQLSKAVMVVVSTTTFISFILEEAVQTAGFGLWIAKDTPEACRVYIQGQQQLVNVVRVIYWCALPFNPITQPAFIVFIEAEQMKIDAYKQAYKE